jgi:predicted permease
MNWSRKSVRKSAEGKSIDGEIAFHIEQATSARMAQGMPRAEARRQALLEFGGTEQVKQQVREVHVSVWLERLSTNSRSALRFVRRSPSFALTIILTLALGIGANSAVFSAIDAIVLRPLPFPHGDELVRIHQKDLKGQTPEYFVAPLRLEDWNRMNSTFQSISGYYTGDATLTSGVLPEKVSVAFVAPRFLQMWGISPALGRDFTREEEKFGGPNAALVSHRFWINHLHADPAAAGKTVSLSGTTYTIAGVLPATFLFPERDVDLWEPNPVDAPYAQRRDATWFTVLGRLKPGVSLKEGQADLVTVQRQLALQYPKTDGNLTVQLQPLKAVYISGIQSSLWLLYGSVSVLLLIACTNIAALLMARTADREHEISIRYSLGASRAAIVGQLLTEVFVLAATGSLLGLLIAAGAPHVFKLFAKDLPRVAEMHLDWRVAGYSLGCALLCTFACGMMPALRGTRAAGRSHLSGSMSRASRAQVSSRNPWQWTLVGVQVSLAVVLLIASGLLLRSLDALARVQPGFDAEHVLMLRISAGWGETMDMGKLRQRIDTTLDALRNVPGVEAAATSSTIAGSSFAYPAEVKISERAVDATANTTQKMMADTRWVSTGYFSALQIPLLQGTGCRAGLQGNQVVVNRSFAEKYFQRSPILGYHLESVPANEFMKPAEILGVVGDAREQGVETAPQPTVYWCFSAPVPDPYFLIRTHGDPAAMAETLRQKIHALEPSRSVFDLMTLNEHLDDRQAENRLRTTLLTIFALTAVALVSLGLYGTISYFARTRRKEIGLRLALGALPRQIVSSFLMQGLRVVLIGCFAGLMVGALASRLLASMLFGVSASDPWTYGGVVLMTLLIALTASLVPSLRAAGVDPSQMLREE